MEDSIDRIHELSPLWRDLALLAPVPQLNGDPLSKFSNRKGETNGDSANHNRTQSDLLESSKCE